MVGSAGRASAVLCAFGRICRPAAPAGNTVPCNGEPERICRKEIGAPENRIPTPYGLVLTPRVFSTSYPVFGPALHRSGTQTLHQSAGPAKPRIALNRPCSALGSLRRRPLQRGAIRRTGGAEKDLPLASPHERGLRVLADGSGQQLDHRVAPACGVVSLRDSPFGLATRLLSAFASRVVHRTHSVRQAIGHGVHVRLVPVAAAAGLTPLAYSSLAAAKLPRRCVAAAVVLVRVELTARFTVEGTPVSRFAASLNPGKLTKSHLSVPTLGPFGGRFPRPPG